MITEPCDLMRRRLADSKSSARDLISAEQVAIAVNTRPDFLDFY
jgi:hypothetical protein